MPRLLRLSERSACAQSSCERPSDGGWPGGLAGGSACGAIFAGVSLFSEITETEPVRPRNEAPAWKVLHRFVLQQEMLSFGVCNGERDKTRQVDTLHYTHTHTHTFVELREAARVEADGAARGVRVLRGERVAARRARPVAGWEH